MTESATLMGLYNSIFFIHLNNFLFLPYLISYLNIFERTVKHTYIQYMEQIEELGSHQST